MNREQKQTIINVAIEEYLNTPENTRSLTQIGKKYGVKRQTLSKYLKERGHDVINYQNRCRINENIFNVIDSEEKAYWLGFIFADGCISSEDYRLEVNLSTKDLNHMLKLKTFLNYEEDIKISVVNGFSVCRLAVRNKNLWNQLNSKGCTPRKSLTLKFPNKNIFESEDLIRHFIRGYVDGDGSLGIYSRNNWLYEELSILGTEEFLTTLRTILTVSGYLRNKSCKNYENKAFVLMFSNWKARVIARFLYENATIYLDRKYNIYINFCQLEEKSSKKKSSKNGEGWDANTVLTN